MRLIIWLPAATLTATALGGTGDPIGKLLPTDGATLSSYGNPVAMDGSLAVVGARGDDGSGNTVGVAYLFDVSTGNQLHKFRPTGGGAISVFGTTVDIDGNTVVVGDMFDDEIFQLGGAAYVFDATTGSLIHKLVPDDPVEGELFGGAVAVQGTIAVATAGYVTGGPGGAYIFDTTTGAQLAKFVPASLPPGLIFGRSLAIDGDTLLVGAPQGGSQVNYPVVYVFDISNPAAPVEVRMLAADDNTNLSDFGYPIDISGNTAVVGAPGSNPGVVDAGAAYIFDVNTGQQLFKVVAQDLVRDQAFGSSVAIQGDTLIIGADGDDDNGEQSGSAYVYDAVTAQPTVKILPADGSAYGRFGTSVALDNDIALVGSYGDAYLFEATLVPCPPDITTQGAPVGDPRYGVRDGFVTAADLNYFVNAYVAGDLAVADLTTAGAGIGDPGYGVPDGLVTAADLNYYVNLWVAGCP